MINVSLVDNRKTDTDRKAILLGSVIEVTVDQAAVIIITDNGYTLSLACNSMMAARALQMEIESKAFDKKGESKIDGI